LKEALRISVATTLLVTAATASAQAVTAPWPTKPIRMIVTFPPGGSSDAAVRIVAPKLGERLGQQVIVDNRPGAGGNIGLAALAKSEADGYTLAVGAAGGLAANASLYPKMPFDAQKDFAPVSLLAHIPFVLVADPNSPIRNVAELLAVAHADPGKLSVGHGGNGTAMHLSVQLLKLLAGVDITAVAYRGSGPVALDVMSGQVPLGMLDLPAVLAQIKAGKVRALAVTGATRLADLPDVPTLAEAGVKGYQSTGWFGIVAPAATPPAVVARLQNEVQVVLTDASVLAQARAIGVELTPTSSADFGRFIASETAKWADVVKRSGTKLD
jgi:tripartite-type tricarboxylate transporter receptor subunit TctC